MVDDVALVHELVDDRRVRAPSRRRGGSRGRSRRCSTFASDPVERSSSAQTSQPSSRSSSERCEPMKPAPPVTRAFAPLTRGRTRTRAAVSETGRSCSPRPVRYHGHTFDTEARVTQPSEPMRKGGSRDSVRAIHRTGPAGRRPRPGRGARAQAQLHRHRAHPARPAPRGGGARCARARVARHHRRGGARPGRPHRRPGRRGHDRPDPVHAAREEGARAGAARGALARPQLHRHRAHPARARARERGRRRAHPARLRRRRREDPQRDHPHALRPRPPPAGRAAGPPGRSRRARSCSTSSAATSRRRPPRASSTPSSAARPRSSA